MLAHGSGWLDGRSTSLPRPREAISLNQTP
jgi:hypothetical protein